MFGNRCVSRFAVCIVGAGSENMAWMAHIASKESVNSALGFSFLMDPQNSYQEKSILAACDCFILQSYLYG